MRIRRFHTLALSSALFATPLAMAQREPPIAVHFARGTTSTTVSGTLIGDATAEYTIQVQRAQTLQLRLTGSNDAALTLYAPGEDTAMDAGGDSQRFSGLLATPGTYRIQLYRPRAPADREQAVARYTLSIALR